MPLLLPIFLLLGWKKLDGQREVQKAVMVYESLNGIAPDYLCSKCLDRRSVLTYSLRETDGRPSVSLPRAEF